MPASMASSPGILRPDPLAPSQKHLAGLGRALCVAGESPTLPLDSNEELGDLFKRFFVEHQGEHLGQSGVVLVNCPGGTRDA